jgi:hypothetical protein
LERVFLNGYVCKRQAGLECASRANGRGSEAHEKAIRLKTTKMLSSRFLSYLITTKSLKFFSEEFSGSWRHVEVRVGLLHRSVVERYVNAVGIDLWNLRVDEIHLRLLVLLELLMRSLIRPWINMVNWSLRREEGRRILRNLLIVLWEARNVDELAIGIDRSLWMFVVHGGIIDETRNLARWSVELLLLLALMLRLSILHISIINSVAVISANWKLLRLVRGITDNFLRLRLMRR